MAPRKSPARFGGILARSERLPLWQPQQSKSQELRLLRFLCLLSPDLRPPSSCFLGNPGSNSSRHRPSATEVQELGDCPKNPNLTHWSWQAVLLERRPVLPRREKALLRRQFVAFSWLLLLWRLLSPSYLLPSCQPTSISASEWPFSSSRFVLWAWALLSEHELHSVALITLICGVVKRLRPVFFNSCDWIRVTQDTCGRELCH